jgi:hypothetical protein
MTEWKTARDVISKFDDRLHDLRKYGFSFITALLAAESLLMPVGSTGTVLPNIIKLAVLIVTLILIAALHLLDRTYRIIQEGAVTRAGILEKALNLELTEVIAYKYKIGHARLLVGGVYAFFTFSVWILGLAIFDPDYISLGILTLAAIVAFIVPIRMKQEEQYLVDWRIDRLECKPRDEVAVTLTNLGKKEIVYSKGKIMWAVAKEGESIPRDMDRRSVIQLAIHYYASERDIHIQGNGENYTWLWKTPSKPGIYRVYRMTVPGEELLFPLKRKLRVTRQKKTMQENGMF